MVNAGGIVSERGPSSRGLLETQRRPNEQGPAIPLEEARSMPGDGTLGEYAVMEFIESLFQIRIGGGVIFVLALMWWATRRARDRGPDLPPAPRRRDIGPREHRELPRMPAAPPIAGRRSTSRPNTTHYPIGRRVTRCTIARGEDRIAAQWRLL